MMGKGMQGEHGSPGTVLCRRQQPHCWGVLGSGRTGLALLWIPNGWGESCNVIYIFFSFVWFSSWYIFQHLDCNTTSSSRMVALSEPPAPGSCPRGNHCPPRAGCTPGCCLEQGVPWLSCFVPGARTRGRRASAWGKVGSWGQSPWGKVDRWLCPEHTGSLPPLLPGPWALGAQQRGGRRSCQGSRTCFCSSTRPHSRHRSSAWETRRAQQSQWCQVPFPAGITSACGGIKFSKHFLVLRATSLRDHAKEHLPLGDASWLICIAVLLWQDGTSCPGTAVAAHEDVFAT